MAESITETMLTLADDGWCVVLKRLPKELGWLIGESRSEYDGPSKATTIGVGKWACEAQDMRQDPSAPYRQDGFAMHDDPQEVLAIVAAHCREQTARAERVSSNRANDGEGE